MKRGATEQKFWDDVAKTIAADCFRRFKKVDGCAHFARSVADAMLRERRDSQRKDNGR